MKTYDVVLIDPPALFHEPVKGKKNKRKIGWLPHLGLISIAAVIEKAGYRIKYVDSTALGMDMEECCREAISYKPRYIGISATTPTINNAAKVAGRLKEICDSKIILGGTHITGAAVKTMEVFPSFDIGVIGEGEETVIELLGALDSGTELKDVKGIIYREGNELKVTGSRGYINDLNSLPLPAWHLLPELSRHYQPNYMSTRRLPSNHLITSRGCYGRCIFCDKSVTGHRVRAYSVDYVIELIDILHNKYGIRDIQINDDSFVSLKDRAHEICDEIIRKGWDITWACDARVNTIDRELMQKMKRAGCWQIAFGIESGSQEILKVIKKGITLAQVERAVNFAKEAGISVKGFFILGHPTETKQTMEMTVGLISRLNIDDFGLTFFTPYPGSPFHEIASQYGEFKESWDTMQGYWVDSFIPKGLTREEMIACRKRAHLKFYLKPRVILSKVQDIRSPFDLLKFANGAMSFSRRFLTSYMLPAKKRGITRRR